MSERLTCVICDCTGATEVSPKSGRPYHLYKSQCVNALRQKVDKLMQDIARIETSNERIYILEPEQQDQIG